MRALVLAVGFGTRLRPLTNKTPKCLVPIKGIPLLDIWLDKIVKLGVTKVLINTHYLSELVEAHIAEGRFSKYVQISYEEVLKGTARTLIDNSDFFENQDALLLHADNFYLGDLDDFIIAHQNRPKNCLMTMMAFHTDSPSSCGILEIDNLGVLQNFYEKKEEDHGNLANGAIYIISPKFITDIKKNYLNSIDFSNDIIPNYLGKIYVYQTNKILVDIGEVERYKFANSL